MEKQKTAVEWLINEIDPNLLVTEKVRLAVQQAKQMEKEQLENFFNQGYTQGMIEDLPEKSRPRFKNSEQYYLTTYGKDENKAENND